MTEISAEEWKRRYAARVMEKSGAEEHQAMEAARVGREVFDEELAYWGEPLITTPEGCADEEMSYWENDE